MYQFILIYCKPKPAVVEKIEVDLQKLKKDFMNVLCELLGMIFLSDKRRQK